jgi:hypothetical protein
MQFLELPYKTKLSIQRDALRLKITDDIVIKMWLMDSKTNYIYKVWLQQLFYSGLKIYNLKYISKTN